MKSVWKTVLLATALLLLLLPARALGNGPAPLPSDVAYSIDVWYCKEEAAYLDLLIPLSTDNSAYVACSPLITETYRLPADCDMVTLCVEGCVSYSAHMHAAEASAALEGGFSTSFSTVAGEQIRKAGADGTLRVALFDARGTLIQVSEPAKTEWSAIPRYSYPTRKYEFNLETGTLRQSRGNGLYAIVFLIPLLAVLMGVTVGAEVLVGKCFRLRPLRVIANVNAASNTAMNGALLALLMFTTLPYTLLVVLLEGIAVAWEYHYYRTRGYPQESASKLLRFTVVANLFSLLLGLGLQLTGCVG